MRNVSSAYTCGNVLLAVAALRQPSATLRVLVAALMFVAAMVASIAAHARDDASRQDTPQARPQMTSPARAASSSNATPNASSRAASSRAASSPEATPQTTSGSGQCVQAFAKAQRQRDAGKLRAASRSMLRCAQVSCPSVLQTRCGQLYRALRKRIPSIVVRVVNESGSDLTNVSVLLDGEPLDPELAGRAIDIDPGRHVLRSQRDSDGTHAELLVVVSEGQQRRMVVLRHPSARPPEKAITQPLPSTAEAALETPRSLVPFAVLGWSLGTASLIAGTALGVVALERGEEVSGACASPAGCSSQQIDDAAAWAHGSTAGFVAAGVLAATGTVLWLLNPSSRLAPSPGRNQGLLWRW